MDGNNVESNRGHDTNNVITFPKLRVGYSLMACCTNEIMSKPCRVLEPGMV